MCGKAFIKPLKTLNLQLDPAEAYAACPFCLTKITEAKIEMNDEPEKAPVETVLHKEKQNRNNEKPANCKYHLGYLSERERNQQIPDECIICEDSLECMLRKMKTN